MNKTKQHELTENRFKQLEGYFEMYLKNAPSHAVVDFGGTNEVIMLTSEAFEVARLIASGMQNRYVNEFSYKSKTHTIPTVRVLTHFEFKCQWLANYFDVPTSTINEYCAFNPCQDYLRATHIDFTPPNVDLTPAEIEHFEFNGHLG